MSTSSVFADCVFCLSGKFSLSQSELTTFVIQHGGRIVPTVSAACTHLISDGAESSKKQSAMKKGLPIIATEALMLAAAKGKPLSASGGGSKAKASKKRGRQSKDDEDNDDDDDDDDDDGDGEGDDDGTVFAGLVFCVSGRLSRQQREVESLITRNGGRVVSAFSGSVSHVISESVGSDKTASAVSAHKPVMKEAWIDACIKEGGMVEDAALYTHNPDDKKDDDDGDVKMKQTRKPKSKSTRKAKSRAADDDDDDDGAADDGDENEDDDDDAAKKKAADVSSTHVVRVKGAAPVDDPCPFSSSHHVYADGSDVYDAMLNQTNVSANNNKFYVIQLLETDRAPKQYIVWNRWGRVGESGQTNRGEAHSSLDSAKRSFASKFRSKTKNDWSARANFKQYSGSYTLIERDFTGTEDDGEVDEKEDGEKKASAKVDARESTLDPRVQKLISTIFDTSMMAAQMKELNYDAKKLPLGKLSKQHILRGYSVLKELADEINKARPDAHFLAELSSNFYTLIPHSFPRHVRPPTIRTPAEVKMKIEMVESLADIAVAMKLINTESDDGEHPLDKHYKSLKCQIKALDDDDAAVKLVEKYIKNTHAPTHSAYSLKLEQLYVIERDGEEERYKAFQKTANRQLLWHGSRLTNFTGILSQGLRIAPPEAPVTGYMFGKGIYTADSVSKSANYCNVARTSPFGCLLLAEVALGEMNELTTADYDAANLPSGKLSTKGVGRKQPNPAQFEKLANGIVVPCGELIDQSNVSSSLLYNEYIVYDIQQVKIKYLAKVKFEFH